jgi:hypothetical protein
LHTFLKQVVLWFAGADTTNEQFDRFVSKCRCHWCILLFIGVDLPSGLNSGRRR